MARFKFKKKTSQYDKNWFYKIIIISSFAQRHTFEMPSEDRTYDIEVAINESIELAINP